MMELVDDQEGSFVSKVELGVFFGYHITVGHQSHRRGEPATVESAMTGLRVSPQ